MFERSLNPRDVIGLLSKLKVRTPDYPVDLMAARKAAFMKQAIAINIYGKGKGGGDGGSAGSGGTGGSGTLGGMSTAQGILLQAVIGVWIIAAMLTTAYIFRDQIIDLLQQNNEIINVELTQAPIIEPAPPTQGTTATEISPTAATPTSVTATAIPGSLPGIESPPENSSDIPTISDDTKDNPGLHLGQTPGPPDTPNQDKPNKPDKPDKK